MKKLTAADAETRSADLVAENVERLKALFPEIVTEGPHGAAVNVDVLKALIGDQTVTDADEKFGLTWHGKRRARQVALTPSTGTLRPCPEDSVDWDTTQNLMIEGDNLEVLKLLQKSYAGKVKLIYIDPPYNTGKDFVYPDNFQDSIRNYLELTGQLEGGTKISSNTEASGRFHTDWLNMMYPRLKLAKNLLTENGLIFLSCDDAELVDVTCALNEIFGEENFVAQLIWKKSYGGGAKVKHVVVLHDYVLCFARKLEALGRLELPPDPNARRITSFVTRSSRVVVRIASNHSQRPATMNGKTFGIRFPITVRRSGQRSSGSGRSLAPWRHLPTMNWSSLNRGGSGPSTTSSTFVMRTV